MAELIKVYRQKMPAMRFIGKQYSDSDRVDGGFGKQWGEWWNGGWFDPIEALGAPQGYEDADATIGLMRWKKGEAFEYWIGNFAPQGAAVPEGYSFVDFDASDLGVGWLKGAENDLYGQEEKCAKGCTDAGFEVITDAKGAYWFFERYGCPRFTTPDENGHVILDICHFIAAE